MIAKKVIGAGSGLLLGLSGILFGWVIFPPVVRNQLEKVRLFLYINSYTIFFIKLNIFQQVALIDGTEQFKRWTILPQPLHFKVRIFNVTNAEQVSLGRLPVVREVGPYVYK